MRWGTRPDQRYDFSEAIVFFGYKLWTFKYSLALNDVFGYNTRTGFDGSTRHSSYAEVNADLPLMDTGLVLGRQAGRQNFKATAGGINADFKDYRAALSNTFEGGWIGSLQLSKNTNTAFYDGTMSNLNVNDRRDIGKLRGALTVTKSF